MPDFPTSVQLFAGTASLELGKRIATHYGQHLGPLQVRRFSDGEIYPQLVSNIQGAHVCLIQSTYPPADNLVELLLTIDAARRAQARHITLVVPYLGYMRQDKAHHAGSPVGAQLQALLLVAAGAEQLITCDLHTPTIANFFACPVQHLSSVDVFLPYIQSLQLSALAFVAPDAGSRLRVQPYAEHFNAPLIIGTKQRNVPNEVATLQLQGDVRGKHAIIIDDIIDTGNTICEAAQELKLQGALTVRALCTHPLLSGKAYETLAASTLDEVVVTDTIPLRQHSPQIKVCSVAPLLSSALQSIC
ncbi:MAG: ribose-phosphate diphosphokinase [Bacteroidota bacterium]